jgi:carotenoid cleavage dioxygenase
MRNLQIGFKMEDLKELLKFLLGFIPWLLFLFLSGHTLASLERSIVICLLASVIFSFKELCKGFILQWGTILFFVACTITINFMHIVFVAKNMGIISNGFLACIIWVTIFIGKPFTLQYAMADLPKERWNDPALIRSCQFIAIVWALLLTFSTLISFFKVLHPTLYPEQVYFDISIVVILGGSVFTTLYKKYRRNQHRPEASRRPQ